MKIIKSSQWRKVGLLSATFLFGILLITSCKKDKSTIGKSIIDQDELLSGEKVDTFSLTCYSYLQDSILTRNGNYVLLGEFNDPVFGPTEASFYAQVRLASVNPNFGDTNAIQIDSVVLALDYQNFQGGFDEQNFEVYELDEEISDTANAAYYQFTSLEVKNTDLVATNAGAVEPNPTVPSIVDGDIQDAQLRLQLNTDLGWRFIREATIGSAFSSDEAFLEYFKGLHVKVNNPPMSEATGGIYYFDLIDPDSKIIIYYHQEELVDGVLTQVKKSYDLPFNSLSNRINNFTRDLSNTSVQEVLDDPALGQKEFYAQAFGIRAAVELSTITDLPKTAIIHKAELFLPIQHQVGGLIQIPSSISVARRLDSTSFDLASLLSAGASYSEFTSGYTMDLRGYVQEIVSGQIENSPIILSPKAWNVSAERIIFNGPNTDNKLRPKLTVVYTEF